MNINTIELVFVHMVTSRRKEKATYCKYKSSFGILRKQTVVGVTCWELKFYMFEVLVLPIFTNDIETWGGDLKNFH